MAEEAGGGKLCHSTLPWQHSPCARRVKPWRFPVFPALVFMLHKRGQTLDLFPSVCSPLTYCNPLLTRGCNVPAVQRWLWMAPATKV